MGVDTWIDIVKQNGKRICSFKTNSFKETIKMKNIFDYILKKQYKLPFQVYILDSYGDYVTLDDDYLEEYNPFGAEIMTSATVQSTTALKPLIKLQVILKNTTASDRQPEIVLKKTSRTGIEHYKQTQEIDHTVSASEPPGCPSIHLSDDPKMDFVNSHNVNYKQRDQYICDKVNVDTGATVGKLSMVQGEKGETNKYQSVLPRFKIWHDGIKNRADHVWALLVFIVLDVCQSGKRFLFYHPGRTFVENDDVTHQLNPIKIPITTDDWMSNNGTELRLTIVVIEGAKKHPNAPRNCICNLEKIDARELFGVSSNHSKSRLVFVLCKDDIIQWESLVLSNEMIFIKRTVPASVINILNIATNTSSKPSKRRYSQKHQTKSNQQSERTKTPTEEDHYSRENLYSSNHDFPIVPDQSCLVNYDNNQDGVITPQTMSNIPAAGSKDVLNSIEMEDLFEDKNLCEYLTETGNPNGNSMNMIDIYRTGFDFSTAMIPDDNVLINSDPSLYDTASFNIDSPNPRQIEDR